MQEADYELSECAVQSIWGYYQDDLEIFDETSTDPDNRTVNYLNHFLDCSKNPYNPVCLATYKGPVDPAIAVGGFLNPKHNFARKSNHTGNQLNHLLDCSKNPYNPVCLGINKRSVETGSAVDGFLNTKQSLANDPDYTKATAVIITILVNNHHNR